MPDELIDLAVEAAADIAIQKVEKRHRWVRILRTIGSILFLGMLAGLVYITVKYS